MPETVQRALTVAARPESLTAALSFLHKAAAEANLPESRTAELDLIVEEILINLSRYAYPENSGGDAVITYLVPLPGELRVEIADQGREFDPLKASAPNLTLDLAGRPIGGLGIFLIRKFAKSLSYQREMGWNRLQFAISAND